MDNIELELKINELLKEDNLLNLLLKAKEFDKEYQKTNFYKTTKIKLLNLLKYFKLWNLFNLKDLNNAIQNFINNLDLSKVTQIISEFGDMMETENNNTLDVIREFKEIVK